MVCPYFYIQFLSQKRLSYAYKHIVITDNKNRNHHKNDKIFVVVHHPFSCRQFNTAARIDFIKIIVPSPSYFTYTEQHHHNGTERQQVVRYYKIKQAENG